MCREKASSAKKYLEEKQRDLEVIEKNMMELNELMKDFAVMVESANEPLDQIDTYLRGTKVPVISRLTFHHPNCNPTDRMVMMMIVI